MSKYTKAFSLMTVKSVDEEKRIITGIATTISPDREDDIVEPSGAKFTLPIPFLWQHDHSKPIGEVIAATVTDKGIEVEVQIAQIHEQGRLKERVDEAWQAIKTGLVKGLSIGFRGKEYNYIDGSYGVHFKEWDWYELSAVTIPANMEASITSVKKLSEPQEEAPAVSEKPVGETTKKHVIVNLKSPMGQGVKL
ncbi:HK97 family phage prohead protease [Neisseria weixii]|uniref:HK97 family phage prohead protease n=1 Tax=Neisseria weixii TaxID=1853276 RepID=UPI00359FA797